MDAPNSREVLAQTETICKSTLFMRSGRSRQLLAYLARAAFECPQASIKETVIGVEVFGLPASYDPKKNSIVRVAVGALRKILGRYYETEGRHDRVRIQIPLGSYDLDIHYEPTIAAFTLNDKAALNVANAIASLDKRTLQGQLAAFGYFDQAMKEHIGHPRLLSLKAMVHAARAMYGRHPQVELEAAAKLIAQAKEQPFESWERYLTEAWIRMALYFDWAGAEQLFVRALELSRGDAKYNSWYTAFLVSQLRIDEALRIQADAVANFAHDIAFTRGDLAQIQIIAGKLDEAEETLRTTMELFPKAHYMPYLHLAILHEARGNFKAAAKAIQRVPITATESTITLGMRPLMIGLAGDRSRAKRLYRQLEIIKRSGRRFVPASQMANAAIGAGDHDRAIAWFVEAAVVERDPIMCWIHLYPFERHVHYHAGFQALVTDTMKLRFPNAPHDASFRRSATG